MKDSTKKILAWVLTGVAIVLFIPVVFAVVMMIAPGVEIFGIKYVSAAVGNFEKKIDRNDLTNKNIHIKTNSVPITITFGEGSGTYGVEYVQHFQGFTKVADTANVELQNANGQAYTGSGDMYFVVTEYKKFIFSNALQDFYLKVKLPSSYSTSGKIYVDSNTSSVTFSGTSASKTIGALDISTSGALNFDKKLTVTGSTKIYANGEIVVGDNLIATGSINVKTDRANLIIKNSLSGTINYETNSGNLSFTSCGGLNVKSHIGDITGTGTVGGNAIVETTYGDVKLKTINGTNSTITSTYGEVEINSATGNLTVNGARSAVKLGTVGNATVKTTTGDIAVTSSTGSVNLTAEGGGTVTCGNVQGNATVISNGAAVTFKGSVAGTLNATTKGGALKFDSCNTLVANTSGGQISAYGSTNSVSGSVNITSGNGNVSVNTIGGDANRITTSNGSINVDVISGSAIITTTGGNVSIANVASATVNSNNGKIVIKKCEGSLTAKTNADVTLGESGNIGDVNADAGVGLLTLKNTVGTITARSDNKVTLNNNSSTSIFINCILKNNVLTNVANGGVEATGLRGNVRVYGNSVKNISLSFAQISGNVVVNAGNACSNVMIDASCASVSETSYDLNSNGICYVYSGSTKIKESKNPSQTVAGAYKISASSYPNSTTITLKFAG